MNSAHQHPSAPKTQSISQQLLLNPFSPLWILVYSVGVLVFTAFVIRTGLQTQAKGGDSLSQWQEYITAVVGAVGGLIAIVLAKLGYDSSKRKKESKSIAETVSNVENMTMENIRSSLEDSKRLSYVVDEMAGLAKRISLLTAELSLTKEELEKAKVELTESNHQNEELSTKVTELTARVSELTEKLAAYENNNI